jgi:hypothetical protein
MTGNYVTQEQLNLRLNTLRYEFGMSVERAVQAQIVKATQPLEDRLGMVVKNAEDALTGFLRLNAEVKAAIDSRNREIGDMNATIREIGHDAALAVQGYSLIKEQLVDMNSAQETRHQTVMTQLQEQQQWINQRRTIEQAVLGIFRLTLPSVKTVIFWVVLGIGSGVLALVATLLRYIR